MQIQLIRNATMRITYAGHLFLADPFFAPPFTRPSFTGRSPNPLIELPLTPDEIMDGIEMIIVSHLHSDHFDPVAQELLPKNLPLFCQPGDADTIRTKGFENVRPLADAATWQGITITRVAARHGSSAPVLGDMGQGSGYVFQAENEPTVYWCGDTVWYEDPQATVRQFAPEVIITHSGGAVWGPEQELIVMDAAQTVAVCEASQAIVLAIHTEALDHCLTSREELREAARRAGVAHRVVVMGDGEIWGGTK